MHQDENLEPVTTPAIGEYYRQFWALQEDQFYYYNQGFLPERLYLDWLLERIKEFNLKKEVGGKRFIDGWAEFGKSSTYGESNTNSAPSFSDFVEFLLQHKDDNRDNKLKKVVRDQLLLYHKQFSNLRD